ncbi:MAG: alpha/beta fold hydrolase [Myxococcota bacterium]|nr:alpha/beta fold hydrolase [Myxococcota bacterium]
MPPPRWFPYLKRSPLARVRLLCLPHAGGTASAFRRWSALLPPTVEVWAAQPPGRETRFADPLLHRVEPWVEALLDAFREGLDLPYAVFGHSLGAVIGYQLIRQVAAAGLPAPVHFFASGREPPDQLRQRVTHQLPEEAFVAQVKGLEGTPPELFAHRELMELLLPILRADFETYETYVHRPGAPLACALTALGGREDHTVSPAQLEAWGAHSQRFAGAVLFPGGHFFHQAEEAAVTRLIQERLTGALSSGLPLAS